MRDEEISKRLLEGIVGRLINEQGGHWLEKQITVVLRGGRFYVYT